MGVVVSRNVGVTALPARGGSMYGQITRRTCRWSRIVLSLCTAIPSIGAAMSGAVAARVSIDSSLCQGHGRCYSVVPELFGFDGEGYGVVLESAISADRVGLA